MPQRDHEPVQHGALRHEAVDESPAQRAAYVALLLEPAQQHDRRRDGDEAQQGKSKRRVAGDEQGGADRDQGSAHSSTSRPSSAERYTASSTRCRAIWSRGGGAFTSPLMTARKYVHSARYDCANGVSRPLAPVGVTSLTLPWISLKTRSGCTLADPFVPTRSNQKRSASPMWRQLTSMESDTPLSHTTSVVAMSSTPSFDCPMVCAATRLAAGPPASHRPRSSSCSPRSRQAAPPASWRRSRQPMSWGVGWEGDQA